jgi:predicted unusual protein kinase regulating ubiquinone biosynthesis (AarF/ABC1/UbiB family)
LSRFALYRRMAVVLAMAARIALELAWLGRLSGRLDPEEYERRQQALFLRQAVRLRETSVALGGMLIKLGQFLSTRVDILPETYTHELAQLQDMVPPVPAEDVRAVVMAELGAPPEQVFQEWESQPVASASFGQVHRARLADGRPVAVKVQRPHLEPIVRADLAAVAIALAFADRWTRWGDRVDLDAIFGELKTVTLQELDYLQEAEHGERFAANFADDPRIQSPAVHHDLTRRRVLVMEYRDGIRIGDRAEIVAAGIDPKAVSRLLVTSYLQQVLRDGFFHADPHPGNIFVERDGSLVFVDFGMMGQIATADRSVFGRLVATVVTHDLDGLIDAIRTLGFLRAHANTATMKKALGLALDRLSGVPISAPSSREFQAFLDEMRDFIYSEPFQLPVQYAFLGRAIGILLGLATQLDPDVDFVGLLRESALPYLGIDAAGRPTSGSGAGPEGGRPAISWDVIVREAREMALLLYRMPRRVERIAERIESGDLRVQIDTIPIQRRLDEVSAGARQTARAMVTGAAVVAAAILTAAGQAADAHWAWGGSAVLALWTYLPRRPRRSR